MIEVCYDAILIITNRLTKYYYFIAYNEAFTAEDLVYIFFKIIINQYNILKKLYQIETNCLNLNFDSY